MIQHLDVRVPWHDSRWDGTVCRRPADNPFCVDLDRIREERDDGAEVQIAGHHFADISNLEAIPPCRNESGAFMSEREWWLYKEHPYAGIKAANATHGHLKRTRVRVPAYGAL